MKNLSTLSLSLHNRRKKICLGLWHRVKTQLTHLSFRTTLLEELFQQEKVSLPLLGQTESSILERHNELTLIVAVTVAKQQK